MVLLGGNELERMSLKPSRVQQSGGSSSRRRTGRNFGSWAGRRLPEPDLNGKSISGFGRPVVARFVPGGRNWREPPPPVNGGACACAGGRAFAPTERQTIGPLLMSLPHRNRRRMKAHHGANMASLAPSHGDCWWLGRWRGRLAAGSVPGLRGGRSRKGARNKTSNTDFFPKILEDHLRPLAHTAFPASSTDGTCMAGSMSPWMAGDPCGNTDIHNRVSQPFCPMYSRSSPGSPRLWGVR